MRTGGGRGVVLLGGPTAGGKTKLAIELARHYDAEIVGADSRQIYRDMPIGTGAPTDEQRAAVTHHLINFLDPFERYSAARYVTDAAAAIAAIQARGKRVIVVGGTGFYLRALAGEVDLARQPDQSVRARMIQETLIHPIDVLHDWLHSRNPIRAQAVSPRDPYRIGRALEVELAVWDGVTGAPELRLPTLRASRLPFIKLAVHVDPAALRDRIQRRTDAMLAAGLVREAEQIGATAVAADAVGYREALAYAGGQLTWTELRAVLARSTRRYAKRQLTWFRAEPDVRWVNAGDLAAVMTTLKQLDW